MKNSLVLLVLLVAFQANAQTKSVVLEFAFYFHQKVLDGRSVTCSVIVENDTIDCPIKYGKITLPQIDATCTLLFSFKKNVYEIQNVDLSKVHEGMNMLIGVEKNTHNFKLLSTDFPTFYRLDRTFIGVDIEHLEWAKEVWFVCFNSVARNDGKMRVGNYSKSRIIE